MTDKVVNESQEIVNVAYMVDKVVKESQEIVNVAYMVNKTVNESQEIVMVAWTPYVPPSGRQKLIGGTPYRKLII
jgi:hypothetical protein